MYKFGECLTSDYYKMDD